MRTAQLDLFDDTAEGREVRERAMLDQLIAATRLYRTSEAVIELLIFIARLRAFAPYNSMLLHIQKPGLTHAATARDWQTTFGRTPKQGARPLLILRTMGPVDFVFDVLDTEGRPLPDAAFTFPTLGSLSDSRLLEIIRRVERQGIAVTDLDAGDASAGWIKVLSRPSGKAKGSYEIAINRNHAAPIRFTTLAHELAHLFLGHLGPDPERSIPDRRDRPHAFIEVEAEMAAWLVARRNGLKPRSESYLAGFQQAIAEIDLYSVMRAANAIETAMGISSAQLRKMSSSRP